MIEDIINLNFEIEKGEPVDQYYFSARIKLTNESKNLLRERLSSTVQFDNLDNYFNLDRENFYIYYNKYSELNGRNELYVNGSDGRCLTSSLPLNHYRFSMEISLNEGIIVDYGFYPRYAIYNPNFYNRAQEKRFDDEGELSLIASNILDTFLSNKSGLTTQDIFLQIRNKIAEEETRLIKEERKAEEELGQKNKELKELMEKGEIILFKVAKGHDMGNGYSTAVLQLDKGDNEIILDTRKYYIAEYQDNEYLHCISSSYDMLLDYKDLFFVLNKSSYRELESGFYSMYELNYGSCDKYLNGEPSFSDNQLSKKLFDESEGSNNQVNAKVAFSNGSMNEEVSIKSEIKPRQKREVEEGSDEQKKAAITSVIGDMEDDIGGSLTNHLKIMVGSPIGMGKYKAVLQARNQDMDNFYQNLSSRYIAEKYDYDQMIALYNKVYMQGSELNEKPVILSEAYIANNHLFIEDQDFGTISDFNKMFYKSDELM